MAHKVPPPPPPTPVTVRTRFGTTLQHQNRDGLLIAQPESTTDTMAGSIYGPETELSSTLTVAPDRVAAEGPPPYSTKTDRSSEGSEATSSTSTVEPLVEFTDFYGRKFALPKGKCDSIDSTRTLVAGEVGLDEDSFDFWVAEFFMTGCMWVSQVKPGTVIALRPSLSLGSSRYFQPCPPTPPLSSLPQMPPQTSTSPSTSAPLLACSDIWEAEGPYTLPFSGCGDRTFGFHGSSRSESLRAFNQYQELRRRTPPERWSGLYGNAVTCGRATAMDNPQVDIGPVLASHLSELQDIVGYSYILIRKAKYMKSPRDKDASAYLDGDSIYQWVSYVSLKHAQAGLVDSLCLGYSIVGSWVELDVSKVSTARLARLTGKRIVVEKCRIFAAVDAASFTGWRERTRLLCSIWL